MSLELDDEATAILMLLSKSGVRYVFNLAEGTARVLSEAESADAWKRDVTSYLRWRLEQIKPSLTFQAGSSRD